MIHAVYRDSSGEISAQEIREETAFYMKQIMKVMSSTVQVMKLTYIDGSSVEYERMPD